MAIDSTFGILRFSLASLKILCPGRCNWILRSVVFEAGKQKGPPYHFAVVNPTWSCLISSSSSMLILISMVFRWGNMPSSLLH
ncbi:hypothetical protein SLE2022_364930 [Rubroshorea leprosula]